MTPPNSKYVSASKPVNRRTAQPAAKAEQLSPVVQERLAAKWAGQQTRNRFGVPLAEQLLATARPERTPAMTAVSPLLITGGVVCAASAVGLLLAAIAQSWWFAGGGAVGLAAGVSLVFFSRRSEALPALAAPLVPALFDAASLQAFDRALQSMAADTPDTVLAALTGLKQQLARTAQQAANIPADEHFTMDDRLYLTELLRRYVPDSLQAYLQVPKNQRAAPVLEQGESAVSLLLGQLQLLGAELALREKKLTQSQAENLLRQQRFLASKSSR